MEREKHVAAPINAKIAYVVFKYRFRELQKLREQEASSKNRRVAEPVAGRRETRSFVPGLLITVLSGIRSC